jgi:hypothetical protein
VYLEGRSVAQLQITVEVPEKKTFFVGVAVVLAKYAMIVKYTYLLLGRC